jgi:alpha-glucosidase (family GH31 glycosyl hydrolase)
MTAFLNVFTLSLSLSFPVLVSQLLQVHEYGFFNNKYSKESSMPKDQPMSSSHPFYLEINDDNKMAHGVLLLNSNAMEVQVGPDELAYRTSGGVLDFFFFLGPSPRLVSEQYTHIIGRPQMPPRWSLGYHQSRDGYRNVDDMKTVAETMLAKSVPMDAFWMPMEDEQRLFQLDRSK